VILDLEDRWPHAKVAAREAVADYLAGRAPAGSGADQSAGRGGWEAICRRAAPGPDGIVLPKAEGAASVWRLREMMGTQAVPILPIASETPAAVFELGTYGACADALMGLTWGAEDLPRPLAPHPRARRMAA
jgi:citrate lyase subunit beta/citryl-CoA lyase